MRSKLLLGGLVTALAFLLATNPVVVDAAGKIGSNKIKKNAVKSKHIKNNVVSTKDIKNNNVQSADIKNGAVTPDKLQDNAMWALVAANGTLVQGRGVVSVVRTGAGLYFVTFSDSVLSRPIAATIYNEGNGEGQVNFRHCDTSHPLGLACDGGQDPRKIFVNTEDGASTNADRIFEVVAFPTTPGAAITAPRVGSSRVGGAEGAR
jgi:hypothetical protein